MSTEETLPPNFQKLDVALRSIGYSFEAAVADVIDNSIDAEAQNILLRLIITKDDRLDLAIWDDGKGMSQNVLKEAMRFGSDVSQEIERLGKFGLGLKLASLSQAREVHVFTRQGNTLSGRAWLEHGIKNGFTSTVYDENECQKLVADLVPDKKFQPSGTVVWWSGLYRVGAHSDVQEHAQKLLNQLDNYLSLAFHRFLSGKARQAKQVRIHIDIFDQTDAHPGIPLMLDPLDPFAYPHSGQTNFPCRMYLADPYGENVHMTAHIWPPNSTAAEYRLPGGANSRQGLYFYRNDRPIQGGSWNGLRETEPHSSLARVEIDVSPEFDLEVSLDVKKIEIHLPQSLKNAIQKAQTETGVDFKKYLALADDAYRKRQITNAELPVIPSKGLPAKLVTSLRAELQISATSKFRELEFVWTTLPDEQFFEIDRDAACICLNRTYRPVVLRGLRGSVADVPLLKCLLFFVLEEAVSSERMSSRIRERVAKVNRILVKAVKYERGL
ncbi:hypothetical protein D769_15470 [Cupriavidus sp. HMR-1]|uniref:ATP-binding protein n=1 Tax=Cupriavidus sp. HMR-1 TaxID=1249621 RepID=UPI0002A3A341|nr:ATP-binding protein [Cupriavidus sp. HMR-1]EKZ98386.1 hypothetical protein D769_15470 [Cupriavidus sp. HMR-1]